MTTKDLGMVTAYAYAVMGGYEGTEAEFEALLGNIATDLEEIENLTVIANTLPEGSSATASYADGVLTLGIPKGDTGATGAGATATVGTTTTGDPGTNASVTNSGTAKDAVFNFTIPRGDTGNGIESIYLTGTSGAVKTYTILFTDGNTTTFDVTDGEVTNASLATILEDYARINGAYESMTVGNAEQLISSVTVNDKVPYNFRTSGGSIDIGNREVDKLVGGTVAWNQLAKPITSTDWRFYDTASNNISDGVASFTASTKNGRFQTKDMSAIQAGKYFVSCKVKLTTPNTNVCFEVRGGGQITSVGYTKATTDWQTICGYVSLAANETPYMRVMDERTSDWDEIKVKEVQLVYTTIMFDSTIADYIYSLETGTAGAGVAWFKKLFPKDYYAYNAGQLMSVKTSAHQMVGFNAYNPTTGTAQLVGGIQYQITGTYTALSLNGATITPDASGYFTPSANGTLTVTGGNSTDTCVHVVWDGERDGEYEEYVKHSYPLDSDLELRGIPKLDASNNLYYDGDTYESDGTVTRKYGIVDLGTLDWTKNSSSGFENRYYAALSPLPKTETQNAIVNGYLYELYADTDDKTWWISSNAIYMTNSAYTDAASFKAAMSGVYLVYELATPTTETLDPYQNPQIVDDFGTEEYVDERTVAIPVGHDTEYMNNLKAKLEMAPDSPDGDGDYIVRQTNGENSYVPLMKELPTLPSEDGTYLLKCTVSGSTKTLGWVEEE